MIKTDKEYVVISERVEELLKDPNNIEGTGSKGYIELNILSDLLVDYEESNFSIEKPRKDGKMVGKKSHNPY